MDALIGFLLSLVANFINGYLNDHHKAQVKLFEIHLFWIIAITGIIMGSFAGGILLTWGVGLVAEAMGVPDQYAAIIGITIVGAPVLLFSAKLYQRAEAEYRRVEAKWKLDQEKRLS